MRGLQKPPERERSGRLLARLLGLIILASGAGVAIYSAVVIERVDLTETTRLADLELSAPQVVDGLTINVTAPPGGTDPVVILHDADVAGGLTLEDLGAALPGRYRAVIVDLPGFGLSTRLPDVGQGHTSAGMAEIVAGVMGQLFTAPVPVIGVGLGGEVAAELAYSYPDLVDGLVMVDTDFWAPPTSIASLEGMPWLGKAATFTWETGGVWAIDAWAPYCDAGGWCPGDAQLARRAGIVAISGTTDSFFAFRRTLPAALAPSNLGDLVVPVAYVWSTMGMVPAETVDRVRSEIAGLTVVESSSFQAHLEDYASLIAALESVGE